MVTAGRKRTTRAGRRPVRRPAVGEAEPVEVTVTRIGAQGDGIADGPNGRLYIPLSVPGDRLRVRQAAPRGDGFAAEVVERLAAGPTRATPPCRHFGQCGGCSLQHLTDDSYAALKLARLTDALDRARLVAGVVDPLVRTPPGARRRATLAALRPATTSNVLVGFQVNRGHHIVDLAQCPILHPQIFALLPALRSWLAGLLAPRQRIEVAVTLADTGLDVVLGWPEPPGLDLRQAMAEFAAAADLARLSVHVGDGPAEPVVQRRAVEVRFGATTVALPPGGFLQASREGEAALVAAVVGALGGLRSAADLFAGAGTFALPLVEAGLRVHAVDADRASLTALASARGTQLSCETRDLFTRPLRADELARFAAVVFDPPRSGARAQAEQLAGSAVPLVVAVSCNPETFARDAHILVDGGYCLERVTPVDQFLWSAHLELAAVFRR